jgi:hypothetical protein
MTTVRLVLAGFLAACGLVALTPSTSYACSCVVGAPSDYVEWADAVFVGTLAEMEPPPRRAIMSSSDPNTYTFLVTRVLEGEVDATTTVESAMSGASCGLEGMQVGREYVVFATDDNGVLESGLCGGTRPANPGYVERVEQVTGPAEPSTLDIAALVTAILAVFDFLP